MVREKGKRELASILCAALVGLAWLPTLRPVSCSGAELAITEFKPYVLQHARAAELERTLANLLPIGSEILVDARGNQLLVRGTASVHQIVERAIESLDRPAASEPQQRRIASPTSLRVYAAPGGQARAVSDSLRNEFGAVAGVKIVPDERSGQILVAAPADVQTRISARLDSASERATQNALAPSQTSAPAVAADLGTQPIDRSADSRAVQLKNTTGAQLEASLSALLTTRLEALPGGTNDVAPYRLALRDGRALEISIDRAGHRVAINRASAGAEAFLQLIAALDSPEQDPALCTRLVPLETTRPADAKRAVEAIRVSNTSREQAAPNAANTAVNQPLASRLFQQGAAAGDVDRFAQVQPPAAKPPAGAPAQPVPAPGLRPGIAEPGKPGAAEPGKPGQEGMGMIGPVQIQMLEGMDAMIVRGHPRDVQQVLQMIQQIEKLSQETEPAIIVHQLAHVDSVALATLVNQLYSSVFATRQGPVNITALVKPNALLLIGRAETVQRVIELVKQLDVPVAPESQFRVFPLKWASATTVQSQIQGLYVERGGLGPVVRVTADSRTNSLIVQAGPRDLAEVATLISRLDTDSSEAVNELRVFRLQHVMADQLVPVLQEAIATEVGAVTGAAPGAPATTAPRAQGQQAGQERSHMLQFLTIDVQGQRKIESGILTDIRITANPQANTLLVSAPAKSMPLIEALVKHLDRPPEVRAEIKVFTIVNGDASALATLLDTLFGLSAMAGQPTAAREGETSLVPLRFAVDLRTNSIIATGSRSDLLVAEAILMRLDESDTRNRKTTVYRLKNAPAQDVALAINEFLRSERALELSVPLASPFEQIEREVIVVAEPVSNSLIIAATPRFYDEVVLLIEKLDERPPMVMIQVLIGEVTLNETDEFGVELGLQDSILFSRGLPSSGDLAPGFNFNGQPLGNVNSPASLATAEKVGAQGLSSLGAGRLNNELGFGGLVLSASSESVSMLLRALKEKRRLEVLGRPQIMTLDNQVAYIQVGQRVPFIRGVSLTQFGQTNNLDFENVGLILQVTPRISPDGLVVMELDAERSDVGPEAEGTPVSISATGQVIRQPRINRTLAQTSVSALSGQTVVLGGLIGKQKAEAHRRVPLISDIPVLGQLFRYDSTIYRRTELLIVMTPQIVKSEEDMERLKKIEAARMHWCLADVIEVNGEGGLRGRNDDWTNAETPVVYPDMPATPPEVIQPPPPLEGPAGNAPPSGLIPLPPVPPNGQTPSSSKIQPITPGRPAATPPLRPLPDAKYPQLQGPAGGVEPTAFDGERKVETRVSYGPPPRRGPMLLSPNSRVASPMRTDPAVVVNPDGSQSSPPMEANPLREDSRW